MINNYKIKIQKLNYNTQTNAKERKRRNNETPKRVKNAKEGHGRPSQENWKDQ